MRARRAALLGCLVAVLGGGCGVPTGGEPDTVVASNVPYGLSSPSSGAPAATSAPVEEDAPRVFLVAPDGTLVPRGHEVDGGTLERRLGDLLRQLAAGPTAAELDDQLATALPPQTTLSVTGLEGGTATVDIAGATDTPSGRAGRRAVAQVVLTATSLPGISAVRLTRDGNPLEAPLPSGELSSGPLTAADYAPALAPGPS